MNQTHQKMKNNRKPKQNPAIWNPTQIRFHQNKRTYMMKIMQGTII
jgi:hypothetical protein